MAGNANDFITNTGLELIKDRESIEKLIADPKSVEARQVLEAADKLRVETVGDGVHLRGLIEFSNYCRNNCLYCGLRRDNRKVSRYRMEQGWVTRRWFFSPVKICFTARKQ